jgi:hypothetical protein
LGIKKGSGVKGTVYDSGKITPPSGSILLTQRNSELEKANSNLHLTRLFTSSSIERKKKCQST